MIRKIEKLAYRYYEGGKDFPCLVFLPGFRSDMTGNKARYLYNACEKRGQSCLLLDYSGHGQSEGRFDDGTIGQWTQDALTVIEAVAKGEIILAGSSMGGWIALLLAEKFKDRIAGLLGIAAAPDFTRDIQARLSDQQKNDLESKDFITVASGYGDDFVITRNLIEEGETQCLLDKTSDLKIPVILIHGKCDTDVAWIKAEKIKQALPLADVEIKYIEDGDHRLSREEDLAFIDACAETISDLSHAGGG